MLKKLLLLIFFVMSISLVSSTYEQWGTDFDDYNTRDEGFFNEQLTIGETVSNSRVLSDPKNTVPLTADLDGDGTNEIVILDANTITIYNDTTLNIVDGYTFGTSQKYSNMLLFDIDGDNKTEIIVAERTNLQINIIEYNGTAVFSQATIAYGSAAAASVETIIQCAGVNDCLVANAKTATVVAIVDDMQVAGFNSTDRGTTVNIDTTVNTGDQFCMPHIPHMSAQDYDNDGDIEYIFSAAELSASGTRGYRIYYVATNGSLYPTLEQQKNDAFVTGFAVEACSTSTVRRMFTSPLVANLDGIVSNGLETVWALPASTSTFYMQMYSSGLVSIERFPLILNADGTILTNVVKADVFQDTGREDFCVGGWTVGDEELDVLCGSRVTSFTPSTFEYIFTGTGYPNASEDYESPDLTIHGTDQSRESRASDALPFSPTLRDENIDELSSSWGVLAFNLAILGFGNTMDLIFENPEQPAFVVMDDYEQGGRSDMLIRTDSNLFYLDDGFTPPDAQITQYTINPCIDRTWKVNVNDTGTANVQIKVESGIGDVQARAILYHGTTSAQDSNWSAAASSGTTFSFSFNANTTINNGNLRMIGRDNVRNVNDTIDVTFSVGTNGAILNDCITNQEVGAVLNESAVPETDPDLEDNAISDFMNSDVILGLNLGTTLLWLIFTIVSMMVTFGGVVYEKRSDPQAFRMAMIFSLLVGLFFIVIGSILGYLPVAIIITLIAISLLVVGAFIANTIMGNRSGGGL